MLFGGSANGVQNTRYDVYDLTAECLGDDETTFEGGKIYIPPVLDQGQGTLHMFYGYGDTALTPGRLDIKHLLCTCRGSELRGGANGTKTGGKRTKYIKNEVRL